MPTNHDETLHERYAREHQAELASFARMTPEQISELVTDLHNALARLAALESQQAASVGGGRDTDLVAVCGCRIANTPKLGGSTVIFCATHAALSPAGGGVVMPDGLPMVISGALFDFAGFLTTREKVIKVGATANASPLADLVRDFAALRGLALDDAAVLSWQEVIARLNAKPQANSQEADK